MNISIIVAGIVNSRKETAKRIYSRLMNGQTVEQISLITGNSIDDVIALIDEGRGNWL